MLDLDRSQIVDLGKDPKMRAMPSAIVDFARVLDLATELVEQCVLQAVHTPAF